MISTSDGSLPKKEAKDFLKRKTEELRAEKEESIQNLVKAKSYVPGDMALYGTTGQDLKSKIQSGEIKIL